MLKISIAQISPFVGDIEGNQKLILNAINVAKNQKADIVVFPELALCGYPPEDLLLRDDFKKSIEQAIAQLTQSIAGITALIGTPTWRDGCCYNSAVIIADGQIKNVYEKIALPNYGVFDECRYFEPGKSPLLFTLNHTKIAVAICEDLWQPKTAEVVSAGCDILLCLNASPYHQGKYLQRIQSIQTIAKNQSCAVVYCHLAGAQDGLVFDGGSFAINNSGDLVFQMPFFESSQKCFNTSSTQILPLFEEDDGHLYKALVCGLRDYVLKNGFSKVLLGLSGGIDSALCLSLCVEALGASNVQAVMLEHIYTSKLSKDLATEQCQLQNVQLLELSISNTVAALEQALSIEPDRNLSEITRQNIQARSRGVLLMALSNENGQLLINTGNKSEMSVGYSTLYGDMCGAFAPIKDVSKTTTYRLANYVNSIEYRIPKGVIERPPSAELAQEQKDSDSLPEYSELDAIIHDFVECDSQPKAINAVTNKVINMIVSAEYKRNQSPLGVKVTEKSFDRERRYPITQGYFKQKPS